MDTRRYFDIAVQDHLSYDEKLEQYGRLADEYFEIEGYTEFSSCHLAHVDELMVEYVESREFDKLLVDTVCAAFPPHEHKRFVVHYRGLLAAWAADQHTAA